MAGDTAEDDANRLREFLENELKPRGWNINKLAKATGRSPSLFYNFQRGDTKYLSQPVVNEIARTLGVTVEELYGRTLPVSVSAGGLLPVEYKVGIFGRAYALSEAEQGEIEGPPGTDPATHFAMVVEGDGMLPIGAGWQLVVERKATDPRRCIGKLCAVRIAGRGGDQLQVREIRESRTPGLYTLRFWNASDIEDVEIEECHLVAWMGQPPPNGK